MSIRQRITLYFLVVILVMSLSIAGLGYYIIKKDIIERAEETVARNLKAARTVYRTEIDRIGQIMRILPGAGDIDVLREKTQLDYLYVIGPDKAQSSKSDIVQKAVVSKEAVGGTRIIEAQELESMNNDLSSRVQIEIKYTPRAIPTNKAVLRSAMSKEYAIPEVKNGKVVRVLYGGRIINKDHSLVDRIRTLVFGNEMYYGKPYGTVTIFQDDVRIATNVLTDKNKRAVGTRISAEVYEKVAEQGQMWLDRAFVVNDWYKTAYEPIRDIHGEVIGILYVGILEKPFNDMARNIFLIFSVLVAGATVLAAVLSMVLTGTITRPIIEMLNGTRKYSQGDLEHKVRDDFKINELKRLASSFNHMAERIKEREQSLKISNEQLETSNQSYVELISFVAHELNGILGSAIMNAYAVRDGFLGMVNFKQRKAIDSVARNLDYLAATVKKFLNLGRIERGQLKVHKSEISLKKDVFDITVSSLETLAVKKDITIENNLEDDMEAVADSDLMQIVANNLISNAIKYGNEHGRVIINGRFLDGKIEIEVYNDGVPIDPEQSKKLFKKFSRLKTSDTKKVKGNGLGLYITKNLVQAHGGEIWACPREKGNSFLFQIERGIKNADTA